MTAFLHFFEVMPTWQKLLWVGICLSGSWILEGSWPLVRLSYRKWRHAGVNLVFMATSLAISVLFTTATVGVVEWVRSNGFGLLYLVDWSVWVEIVLTVMLLDLVAQYIVHVLLHKVPALWRLHMIHHSDTKVDATTGTRHHPADFFVRETFALAAIVLAGAPLAYYMIYRLGTILFTYLTHANLAVPRWLDAPLSLVFVTPNMHKFHHHYTPPWTDRNYGGIFSVWDRVFGTFVYGDPRTVRYGLDTLDDASDENLAFQFKMPFDRSVNRGR